MMPSIGIAFVYCCVFRLAGYVSPRLRLIHTTLESEDLGITKDVFEEIRSTTTLIIHNAWRLDFNLVFSSFTPQLDSVANLARLAISSPHSVPPRILFTSSIGVVSSWSSSAVIPEEPLTDLSVAINNGYSESKAVAEKNLEKVVENTPVRSTIFRIGQLSGSAESGAWSTSDWVPLIVRSGQEMGMLPECANRIDWLSVDIAASVILELRHSIHQTLHIVHPHPVTWSFVFREFALLLDKPLVPFTEWVERLEADAKGSAAMRTNPALALLEFFKHLDDSCRVTESLREDGVWAEEIATLSIERSMAGSHSLWSACRITEEDVRRWVHYWKMRGFLHS
ncbi:hypothetical protein FRB93_011340 [Tulasnella sp. JGI-2019a]|nr:hypothetical protein FRB93_011340 [Tulasnella sp. JGI-2019a]